MYNVQSRPTNYGVGVTGNYRGGTYTDKCLAPHVLMRPCRRKRRQKIRAQAWSLFARLFNIQELELQYFETISNNLHFDFQFLEFRHDNRKLFPD